MKLPAISKVRTEDEARELAIDYQTWQQDNAEFWMDVIDKQNYFQKLAKKFKLTEEFTENGIL